MMVYVLNINGQPLMPTRRCGKVRRLLKEGKATVVKRCPFTIKLNYETENITQPVTLGVDAGFKHIGLSATTKDKELYASDVELRNDIVDLLSTRRELRRGRRNRKTRYRKARFNNRVHSKSKGWIAPSVEQKIQCHLTVIDKIHKILPVTNIVVEAAQFDTQLLKALEEGKSIPQGTDYQKGELSGFANLREYCFWRDGYTCQWCKGKSKNKILHMHHWNYWNGDHTDKPSSVITLCDVCNDSKNHKPEANTLWGWKPKITKSYKDATFMGIMRWTFYNRLKEKYPDIRFTYGYLTKSARIKACLPKEHYIDARCISGNPLAKPLGYVFYQKKVRCHNRQIHKANICKGGIKKRNQAEYEIKGFRLFDKVKAKGEEYYIHGRRQKGAFVLKKLSGEKLEITPSKIKLISKQYSYITERRSNFLSDL